MCVGVQRQTATAVLKERHKTHFVGVAEGRGSQCKVKEAENKSKTANLLKKGDGRCRRQVTNGGTATGSSSVLEVGVGVHIEMQRHGATVKRHKAMCVVSDDGEAEGGGQVVSVR